MAGSVAYTDDDGARPPSAAESHHRKTIKTIFEYLCGSGDLTPSILIYTFDKESG